jgi:phosphoenolpyruvate synthase/pyruvate phosphate dikinase
VPLLAVDPALTPINEPLMWHDYDANVIHNIRDAQPLNASKLHGTPVSGGVAVGSVRIIRRSQDVVAVRPGDIVVCVIPSPAIASVMGIAAGVIAESGSALSSAAIVAREHRLPAVFGVRSATTALHDGQLVTIDGHSGAVTPEPHLHQPRGYWREDAWRGASGQDGSTA